MTHKYYDSIHHTYYYYTTNRNTTAPQNRIISDIFRPSFFLSSLPNFQYMKIRPIVSLVRSTLKHKKILSCLLYLFPFFKL